MLKGYCKVLSRTSCRNAMEVSAMQDNSMPKVDECVSFVTEDLGIGSKQKPMKNYRTY